MEDKLFYKELSYLLRGILFEVHNELGIFRNEKQYADCFEQKLKERNVKYEREKVLPVSFKGERKGRNRIDFLIDDKIIVELKAVTCLAKDHYFQCQRYLVSLNVSLALLVNFRTKYLNIKRILNYTNYNP